MRMGLEQQKRERGDDFDREHVVAPARTRKIIDGGSDSIAPRAEEVEVAKLPRCPACDYLLVGDSARCPECGLELTEDVFSDARWYADQNAPARRVVRRQVWMAAVGAVSALAGVVLLFTRVNVKFPKADGDTIALLLLIVLPALILLALYYGRLFSWPPHWGLLLGGGLLAAIGLMVWFV